MKKSELVDYFRSMKPDELKEFRTTYLELSQRGMAKELFTNLDSVLRWEARNPKRHSAPHTIVAYWAIERFSEQLERYYTDKQVAEAAV